MGIPGCGQSKTGDNNSALAMSAIQKKTMGYHFENDLDAIAARRHSTLMLVRLLMACVCTTHSADVLPVLLCVHTSGGTSSTPLQSQHCCGRQQRGCRQWWRGAIEPRATVLLSLLPLYFVLAGKPAEAQGSALFSPLHRLWGPFPHSCCPC